MIASQFLAQYWPDILQRSSEHLNLALLSVCGAVLLGVPLGILVARVPAWRPSVLGFANVMQTIPSLALFGFLLPVLGLGTRNAIVALILYSLLPIVRNTFVGIDGVDRGVREAARAMGMTNGQILRRVELPLAADVILAGIRTATVLCIGIATIASFIGAGGLGELIENGLRTNDNAVTLAGAIPATAMALGADWLLGSWQQYLKRRQGAESLSVWRRAGLAVGGVASALIVVGLLAVPVLSGSTASQSAPLIVGCKDFTESRILAEILVAEARQAGIEAQVGPDLSGNLCHKALLAGKIDAYPEYTGTAYADILRHKPQSDPRRVLATVQEEYARRWQVTVSAPLGFSNGFAMLIRGSMARQLGISTLSQAVPFARNWTAGFGPDFITRADGWPGLKKVYGLTLKEPPHSLDLGLLNRALASKQVDLIAGNETDGTIPALNLFELQDNLHYFPPYQGVFMVKEQALKAHPGLAEVLAHMAGTLNTAAMQKLNEEVDGEGQRPSNVAKQWLARTRGAKSP